MRNHEKRDPGSDTPLEGAMPIQDEIVRQFQRGPNPSIARGVALEFAQTQRDYFAKHGEKGAADEWNNAVASAEEGMFGSLKSIIDKQAGTLLDDAERSSTPRNAEDQARSLINLAKSL